MIKVDQITIEEFRGIRSLTLTLGRASFAICGPNDTGKSGIVDALEFGLTGNISRLSGKGRGALSVKEHGPHVDSKDHPERAKVILEIFIPSLGKKARIERSVKAPRAPTITPNEADIRAVVAQVEQHPEIVLSRREIIKYVLTEPGERAKEVQALLQLDDLETARVTLQKIANACDRELKPLEADRISKAQDLARAMGTSDLKQDTVLAAANARRKLLSLPPLTKLIGTTTLRDGLESQTATAATHVPKTQAVADLAAADIALSAILSSDFRAATKAAIDALHKLKDDESKLRGIEREGMLRTALELFDEKTCPVCETAWDPGHFRTKVNHQLKRLEEIGKERAAAELLLTPVIERLDACGSALATIAAYVPKFPASVDGAPLDLFRTALLTASDQMRRFLPLQNSLDAMQVDEARHEAARDSLRALEAAVKALPEPSDRDAARDYLTVADERLNAVRTSASKAANTRSHSVIARKVFEIYGREIDAALASIYKDVETEFRTFYRAINHDDESAFDAKLMPSLGKLGFDVEFYGRGFFPPGAYHSEGHQDGMGLCLYLALMKYLFGGAFTFAVLDDVLMSVDAGHRREVCSLLKSALPNAQFILTTHDPVWLRHMITAGLVRPKSAIEFRKWDVDHGPAEWKSADVWTEIDTELSNNEIGPAAGHLRLHLEYLSGELCGLLGGRVEYRGDGRYELGDLLPAAAKAMRDLLREAKAAANSWNKKELMATIGTHEERFAKALSASLVEQWYVNPAIHFNEWANFQRGDFAPVVAAFKELEETFRCSACDGYLYLVRSGKINEILKCDCGGVNLSLSKKAA